MAMQTAQSFKEIQDVTDQYEVISAQLAEIVKAQTDAVTEVNEQLDSLKRYCQPESEPCRRNGQDGNQLPCTV